MVFLAIQQKIGSGKVSDAIQFLKEIAITKEDTDLQKSVCLLSFRYSILKEEKGNGTIDHNCAVQNQMMIGKSLLDIAESLG